MRYLAWAVVCIALADRCSAVFEGLNKEPPNEKSHALGSYITFAKPILKSLCNFGEETTQAAEECSSCVNSINLLLDNLLTQRTWAIQMVDALVKPPTGLLSGTFSLVSHFDQCMNIREEDTDYIVDVLRKYPNVPSKIKGAYCSFKLRVMRNQYFVRPENETLSEFQATMKKEEGKMDDAYKLQPEFPGFLGLCVPSSCTKVAFDEIGKAVKQLLWNVMKNKRSSIPMLVGIDTISCKTNDEIGRINWTIWARLIVAIIGAIVLLVAVGTIVDIIFCITIDRDDIEKDESIKHSYDYMMRGDLAEMLRSCSIVVSFRRLMDTRLPHDTIKCLNGVKFFAIFWLIMGNTGQLRAGNMTTNLKEMQKALENMSSQFVLNKDLAVDSLFVVSGILFAFGLSKRSGFGHVVRYFLHRVIKVLPMYYLLSWFLICCFNGLGYGPTWDIESERYLKKCGSTWWANIAFMNNFLKYEDQCMPHTFIVAMLAQALIISVIANFFWKKAEDLTHFGLGILVLVTMALTFGINLAYNVGPTTLLREYRPGSRNEYMSRVGMHLYTRGGPFLIGLIIGFIFNQTLKQKRVFSKLGKLATTFMWLMILTVIVCTVNATFNWNRGTSSPSSTTAAFYDSFHRVVFAFATGLLIMMCYAGKGGFINMILSWSGFVPLARVWLIVYLIHPFVIFHGNGTLGAPQYYTKKLLFTEIIWNFVMSHIISLIVHCLFVAPFLALENFVYQKIVNAPDSDDEDLAKPTTSRYSAPIARVDPEVGSVRSSPGSAARNEEPEPYNNHRRDFNDSTENRGSTTPLLKHEAKPSLDQRSTRGEFFRASTVDQDIPLDFPPDEEKKSSI